MAKVVIFPLYPTGGKLYDDTFLDLYLQSKNTDIYHVFSNLEYEPILFRSLLLRLIETEKAKTKELERFCEDEIPGYEPPCKLTEEVISNNCKQYVKRRVEIDDVLRRDEHYTFIDEVSNVVMLLYNDMYYGHVYSWDLKFDLSFVYDFKPDINRGEYKFLRKFVGKKVTMMVGIRSRVESLFLRSCGIEVKNVAKRLLEAVRQHAMTVGSFMIAIPQPIGPMPEILKSVGFQKVTSPGDKERYSESFVKAKLEELHDFVIVLGFLKQFRKYWGDCRRCYFSINIDKEIIDSPVYDYSTKYLYLPTLEPITIS